MVPASDRLRAAPAGAERQVPGQQAAEQYRGGRLRYLDGRLRQAAAARGLLPAATATRPFWRERIFRLAATARRGAADLGSAQSGSARFAAPRLRPAFPDAGGLPAFAPARLRAAFPAFRFRTFLFATGDCPAAFCSPPRQLFHPRRRKFRHRRRTASRASRHSLPHRRR